MIWGAVWNSIFISTVFPLITLNQNEYKAFNLFERTNKRNELEDTSSYILTNAMRMLGQLNSKINRHIDTAKLDKTQLDCLNSMRKLNKVKKQMDSLVIETLYMEDDMISKMEIVVDLNEKISEIQIKIEDVYRKIFEIPGFASNGLDKDGKAMQDLLFKKPFSNSNNRSSKNVLSASNPRMNFPIHNIQYSSSSSNSDSESSTSSNSQPKTPPKKDTPKSDYLEPDAPHSICHSHNFIRFDSMNNIHQVVQMPSDDVVVNNIEHLTGKVSNLRKNSSVSDLYESELNLLNNANMDWVVFTPLFITFGKPAKNHVPTFVQQVYYSGKR